LFFFPFHFPSSKRRATKRGGYELCVCVALNELTFLNGLTLIKGTEHEGGGKKVDCENICATFFTSLLSDFVQSSAMFADLSQANCVQV